MNVVIKIGVNLFDPYVCKKILAVKTFVNKFRQKKLWQIKVLQKFNLKFIVHTVGDFDPLTLVGGVIVL